MTCIGLLQGRGVARDPRSASRWCDGAARQGNGWAQVQLGDMFRTGQGMPRMPGQAYYWFTVAANGTGSAAGMARERRARMAQEISQAQIDAQNRRAAAFRPQPGLHVREQPLPELARGDRVTVDNVSITVPAPAGYFNNWQFVEEFQRLAPNSPELTPNLLVLANREDMDRWKMGLPGGMRSVEVAPHNDDGVNVTKGMFADVRKLLVEAVEKSRASGRMNIEIPRNDDSALVVVREALDGGNAVDARAWIRVNGRVLAVYFTGFTHEQLQDLRRLAPEMAKGIAAENAGGVVKLFGASSN